MSIDRPQKTTSGTVSLSDEEAVKAMIVSTVFSLWDIVNNLTRLRPTKRERFRVTIFGSARAQPGTVAYGEVKRVATALAEMGCELLATQPPLANAEDFDIPCCVDTADEAIALIREHHACWSREPKS